MPHIVIARRPPVPRARRVVIEQRPTARERGYGAAWDRMSLGHRRAHPFCARCLQRGEYVLADVVDHKVRVIDGGPIFARWNRWSLCNPDHNGWKRTMEELAAKMGDPMLCLFWCDDPRTRPPELA